MDNFLSCLKISYNESVFIALKKNESAKSRAWRALRVYVLACSRAHVLGVLSACVLTCLACLRAWCAYVLACLRAWCACVCTCVLVMMKCFIFLRVCVLGVLFCLISFTFQYLNLKIRTAKNCVLC